MASANGNQPFIIKIENALDSRFFRRFMSMAYGLGASIVIIGALFKITHIKGANEALFIGMVTEAIIFALSALQKPHIEPDWSKVHPQLGEDYHGKRAHGKKAGAAVAGGSFNILDTMLEKSGINQELINRLGVGMQKLSDQTGKLSDISLASVATEKFVTNVNSASESALNLSNSYETAARAIGQEASASSEFSERIKEVSQAASGLKNVYSEASKTLQDDIEATQKLSDTLKTTSDSAAQLSEGYFKSAETIARNIEELQNSTTNNTAFNQQIHKLSDNLSALNSLYELQLKNSGQQTKASIQLLQTMDRFLANIEESSNKTVQYQDEMVTLTNKMASLNSVYGNMLSALNVK